VQSSQSRGLDAGGAHRDGRGKTAVVALISRESGGALVYSLE
jgi:hypothetical protein